MQLIEQAFTDFFKFYRETAEQHVAISELFGALSFLNSDLILIYLIRFKHIGSHLLQHNNEFPKDNLARLCKYQWEIFLFHL